MRDRPRMSLAAAHSRDHCLIQAAGAASFYTRLPCHKGEEPPQLLVLIAIALAAIRSLPEHPLFSFVAPWRAKETRDVMKIQSHAESHIVELDDGSRWQIYPGDLDLTLNWKPETDIAVVPIDDELSSHALVGGGGTVRVIPAGENWPVRQVRSALKDG
jgi:hypothetical protein